MTDDPYAHHPGLRGLIKDPLSSFFRDFDIEDMLRALPAMRNAGFAMPVAEREAGRRALLDARPGPELWVFAYGSLMWDPGFHFAEVRRAFVPGFARRFILYDTFGARGDPEHPGVMAALDTGPGCHGLAFRIAPDLVEEESRQIWARERSGYAYREAFVQAELTDRTVTAATFVADHDAAVIRPDLSRDDQVRAMATGRGVLGSSLEYAENLVSHFAVLRIRDDELEGLVADARALAARLSPPAVEGAQP